MNEPLLNEVMAVLSAALVLGLLLGAGAIVIFGSAGWFAVAGFAISPLARVFGFWRNRC